VNPHVNRTTDYLSVVNYVRGLRNTGEPEPHAVQRASWRFNMDRYLIQALVEIADVADGLASDCLTPYDL
jgi:hypothetical protein